MKHYIIALTGGIGSGKSTIASMFSNLGVPIIDSDIISKMLTIKNNSIFKIIVKHFGLSILDEYGSLNRSEIRNCIFNDIEERKWLNNLLHPLIYNETKRLINNIHVFIPYAIWVVPLLIENSLHRYPDRILVVDTTYEEQVIRVINRDNVSHSHVEKILLSQASRESRLKYANDVIDSSKNYEEIKKKVINLHKLYLYLSKQKM